MREKTTTRQREEIRKRNTTNKHAHKRALVFFRFPLYRWRESAGRQRIRSLDYHQVALIQLISDTFPVAWRHGRPAVWFGGAFPLVPIDSRTMIVSRYSISPWKMWWKSTWFPSLPPNNCRNSYHSVEIGRFWSSSARVAYSEEEQSWGKDTSPQ